MAVNLSNVHIKSELLKIKLEGKGGNVFVRGLSLPQEAQLGNGTNTTAYGAASNPIAASTASVDGNSGNMSNITNAATGYVGHEIYTSDGDVQVIANPDSLPTVDISYTLMRCYRCSASPQGKVLWEKLTTSTIGSAEVATATTGNGTNLTMQNPYALGNATYNCTVSPFL